MENCTCSKCFSITLGQSPKFLAHCRLPYWSCDGVISQLILCYCLLCDRVYYAVCLMQDGQDMPLLCYLCQRSCVDACVGAGSVKWNCLLVIDLWLCGCIAPMCIVLFLLCDVVWQWCCMRVFCCCSTRPVSDWWPFSDWCVFWFIVCFENALHWLVISG